MAKRTRNEDKIAVINCLFNLKNYHLQEFLEKHRISKAGKKSDLIDRIITSIEENSLQLEDLIDYYDDIAPNDKQHVFLFNGPQEEIVNKWIDGSNRKKLIKSNDLEPIYNKKNPLTFPRELKLESVIFRSHMLSIKAVQGREYFDRRQEMDEYRTMNGQFYVFRAYEKKYSRGNIFFNWNLINNTAELKITQLPSGDKYEDEENKFKMLIQDWLNLNAFPKLNLKTAISKLHEMEESTSGILRSHGFNYVTNAGNIVTARSATCDDSVIGERVLNTALRSVRMHGQGNLGNFYWICNRPTAALIRKDVHFIVVGEKNRVNFTTPNNSEDIQHVLSKIREFCS